MAATFLLTLMNCGTTTTTTNDTTAPAGTTTTTVPTRRANTTTGTPDVSERSNGNRNLSTNNTSPINQDPTVNQADIDLQRTKQMYTDIDMTPEQIEQFETESRTWMEAWKRDNPQGVLSTQDRLQQQNIMLKSILDARQYQNYELWMRENPYRN